MLQKKNKKPQMTPAQKAAARPKCRKMLEKYNDLDFLLDDESYFTLSNLSLPGNDRFYSSNVSKTSESVKNKYKAKFEPNLQKSYFLFFGPNRYLAPGKKKH
jgi:hypothetical protein